MTNFERVKQFMDIFGQTPNISKPMFPHEDILNLRDKLIAEEFQEYRDAVTDQDIVEVADALTDILYVVYGAGIAFGIDLDDCFEEVHDSNMSKLGPNNQPIYNDIGKVVKVPNYRKPDLKKILGV